MYFCQEKLSHYFWAQEKLSPTLTAKLAPNTSTWLLSVSRCAREEILGKTASRTALRYENAAHADHQPQKIQLEIPERVVVKHYGDLHRAQWAFVLSLVQERPHVLGMGLITK